MKSFSVKFTVMAAITGLGLLALVQAGVGWFSIGQLSQNFAYMSDNALPTIEKVSEIRKATLEARALLGEEVLADTAAKMLATDGKATATIAGTESLVQAYKPLIVDEGDQKAYDNLVASWQAWKTAAIPIQKAARGGDSSAALRAFGGLTAASEAVGAAIETMSADKVSNAADATRSAQGAIRLSRIVAGGLSALVLIVVAAASMTVLRRVIAPLASLTGTMNRIAAGELELTVPGRSRRDEIGAMAEAVEVFRENGLRVQALTADERASAEITNQRAAETAVMSQHLTEAVSFASRGEFSRRIPTGYSQENLNSLADVVNNLMVMVDRGLAESGKYWRRSRAPT